MEDMLLTSKIVGLSNHHHLLSEHGSNFDKVHSGSWDIKTSLTTAIHLTTKNVINTDFIF